MLRAKQQQLAIDAVENGVRPLAELDLQQKLSRRLMRVQQDILKEIGRSGIGSRLANLRIRGPDRKKLADDATKILFEPILDWVAESDARHQILYQLRVSHYRMYEYGAVVALNLMGFAATSRRVTDMEKEYGRVDVRKAVSARFELEDREIIDSIENRVVRTGAGTLAATVEDTRRLTRDMVVLSGLSTQDVADSLTITEGFPQWYSNRLARTEMHQSYESAMNQTYVRSGVPKHSWLTVGDRRVRPWHVMNEMAGPIRIGAFFPSGQLHPGDGALSINCRCSAIPELDDLAILLEPWDGRSVGALSLNPTGPSLKPPPLKVVSNISRREKRLVINDISKRMGITKKEAKEIVETAQKTVNLLFASPVPERQFVQGLVKFWGVAKKGVKSLANLNSRFMAVIKGHKWMRALHGWWNSPKMAAKILRSPVRGYLKLMSKSLEFFGKGLPPPLQKTGYLLGVGISYVLTPMYPFLALPGASDAFAFTFLSGMQVVYRTYLATRWLGRRLPIAQIKRIGKWISNLMPKSRFPALAGAGSGVNPIVTANLDEIFSLFVENGNPATGTWDDVVKMSINQRKPPPGATLVDDLSGVKKADDIVASTQLDDAAVKVLDDLMEAVLATPVDELAAKEILEETAEQAVRAAKKLPKTGGKPRISKKTSKPKPEKPVSEKPEKPSKQFKQVSTKTRKAEAPVAESPKTTVKPKHWDDGKWAQVQEFATALETPLDEEFVAMMESANFRRTTEHLLEQLKGSQPWVEYGVSGREYASGYYYQKHGYTEINSILRTGKPAMQFVPGMEDLAKFNRTVKSNEQISKKVKDFIAKSHTNETTDVFRGISGLNQDLSSIRALKAGDEFIDDAVFSTTRSFSTATEFLDNQGVMFYVKTHGGADMAEMFKFSLTAVDEEEILVQAATKFRVTKIVQDSRGHLRIYLEEIVK